MQFSLPEWMLEVNGAQCDVTASAILKSSVPTQANWDMQIQILGSS